MNDIYPQNPRNIVIGDSQELTITHTPPPDTQTHVQTLAVIATSRLRLTQLLGAVSLKTISYTATQDPLITMTAILKLNGQALASSVATETDILYLSNSSRNFFQYVLPAPIFVEKGDTMELEVSVRVGRNSSTTVVLQATLSITGDWVF